MRTIAEINDKIARQQATVWTVEALKARVEAVGVSQTYREVDIATTGTFEPMESSGAMLNLGHTNPPINIRQCWLDGIPAYAGLGAVDLYLGAATPADQAGETGESEGRPERGGGHAIADLVAGRQVQLRALGQVSDCYPRASFETALTADRVNQFQLFNPRNLYQNSLVGVNAGDRPLYTYLGPLQPHLGNAVYANPGALSPLFNDPHLELTGIGSRVLLGGGIGYVVGEGTQHFPRQQRLANGTPIGPASTLALAGDAKQMSPRFVRGCYFQNYGPSLMLGIGVPIPLLHETAVERCAVADKDIVAPVVDFSIPRRIRPTFGLVSYAQLKSGRISLEGKTVRVAPLASIPRSREIAQTLKSQIEAGQFTLTEPVAPLPQQRSFNPQGGTQMALE